MNTLEQLIESAYKTSENTEKYPFTDFIKRILNCIPVAIVITDFEDKILFANSHGQQKLSMTTDLKHDELLNRRFSPDTLQWKKKAFMPGDHVIGYVYTDAADQNNDAMFKGLLDSAYDGIYVTDAKGKTIFLNDAYERISGIDRDLLLNNYMDDLVREGVLSVTLTKDVVKSRKPITLSQTNQNNKQVVITGSPVLDETGKVSKVITNVRDVTELVNLQKELHFEKKRLSLIQDSLLEESSDDNVVCNSEAFKEVLSLAKKVSKLNSSVLILGETGTGKEVVAQYIHRHGHNKTAPFVKTNCGAISKLLLESELFGYAPGAFTGASSKGKIGLFELADNGTLFLDEIGELPLELQTALLRVLQDGELTRVGDTVVRKVNVRIIAATNRDLEAMTASGEFRQDLYFRLNVINLQIPPLRERKSDIPFLAEKMLSALNKKYNEKKVITQSFINSLLDQDWPGNIRELNNYIERQFVLSEDEILDSPDKGNPSSGLSGKISISGLPSMEEAKQELESILIARAMREGGSTYKAAALLKMSQPTFYRRYKQLFPDD